MKNFDRLIIPDCEPAIAQQNERETCVRDPRCDDPSFAAANPGLCGVDARCQNQDFAAAHPEICGATTDALVLKPSSLTICEGKSTQLRAFIVRGTVETEITTGLIYRSSDLDVALVGALGGNVSGVAEGISTISVEWLGKRAYSQVQVMAGENCCEDVKNSIAILIDNSKSMSGSFGGVYSTKLAAAKDVARKFIHGVDLTKDCIGIYDFSDAITQVLPFSVSATALATAVNGLPQAQGKTDVGDALQTVADDLAALAAVTTNHKIIVIVSDFENKLGPDPLPIAQAFFDTGGVIICVGIRANGAGYVLGNRLASGGFFLNVYADNVDDAMSSIDGIKSYFCSGDCIPSGDVYASRAALNYATLTNWNITAGLVDLIGSGSDGVRLYDLLPGNGLYIDAAGSGPLFDSTLETKDAFTFDPGNDYKLTVRVAGNQRRNLSTGKTVVTLGDVTGEITRTWTQNFTDEEFEFTVDIPQLWKLSLQYISATNQNAYGYLYDTVKIENLTTGEMVFVETWDNENLTYIPPSSGQGVVADPDGNFGYGYNSGNDCLNIPPDTQTPDPIISIDLEEAAPPPVFSSTKSCTKSCPVGSSGSDATATATASSIISQADADAKALAQACAAATASLSCLYGFGVGGLLNVNFKFSNSELTKVGLAAAPGTSADVWGVLGGDGGVAVGSSVSSSGTATGVSIAIVDSFLSRPWPAHYDPMMQSGIGGTSYAVASVPLRVTVKGLPVGEYDIYLYGHQEQPNENGDFQVQVGTLTAAGVPILVTDYGTQNTTTGSGYNGSSWLEHYQYVKFHVLVTDAAHAVLITSLLAADGLSRINGLQIRRTV